MHRQHERGLAEFAGHRQALRWGEAGVDKGFLAVDLGSRVRLALVEGGIAATAALVQPNVLPCSQGRWTVALPLDIVMWLAKHDAWALLRPARWTSRHLGRDTA